MVGLHALEDPSHVLRRGDVPGGSEFVAYELGDVEAVRELVVASGAGVSTTHSLSVPAQRDPRDPRADVH